MKHPFVVSLSLLLVGALILWGCAPSEDYPVSCEDGLDAECSEEEYNLQTDQLGVGGIIGVVGGAILVGGLVGSQLSSDSGSGNDSNNTSSGGDSDTNSTFVAGDFLIDNGADSTNSIFVTLLLNNLDRRQAQRFLITETETTPDINHPDWQDLSLETPLPLSVSYAVTKDLIPSREPHTLYLWLQDNAGQVLGPLTDDITISITDVDTPFSDSIIINGGDSTTDNTSASVKVSAFDNVGIVGYLVSEDSATPAVTDSRWNVVGADGTFETNVSFELTAASTLGNHPRTVYAWFRDAAGNQTAGTSDSITLVIADETLPTSPQITLANGNSSTSQLDISVALSAQDETGITGYLLSEFSDTPELSNSAWVSVTATQNLSITTEFALTRPNSAGATSRTVYAWFRDAAGNLSSRAEDSITLNFDDATLPTNTSIVIDSGSASTNTTTVSLSVAADDDTGVTEYFLSESSDTPLLTDSGWTSVTAVTNFSDTFSYELQTTNALITLSIWFRDAAGNISARANDQIIHSNQ